MAAPGGILKYFKHDSAIIDEHATIGTGTKIWHFTHISAGARIGDNCTIGQNVYVSQNARIGNRVKIQNNVSVYDEVTLEDDVFCGPSVVFTNVINPRAFVERKSEYRKTLIQRGATLGANSTIICGVTIGEFALVGAGSVVTKKVPPYAIVMGNPAKQTGWVSEHGEKLDLPIAGNGKCTCNATGRIYILKGEKVTMVRSDEIY